MEKYIVTADIANDPYSTCVYLYGVFNTQEEALQFIKGWKPNKDEDSPFGFNFVKNAKKWISNNKELDEQLINDYIIEFKDVPICLASYCE